MQCYKIFGGKLKLVLRIVCHGIVKFPFLLNYLLLFESENT